MSLKVSFSLVISIILHVLLVWFLFSHKFTASLQQADIIPDKKSAIINSYVYNSPSKKTIDTVADNQLISEQMPVPEIKAEEKQPIAEQAELDTTKPDELSPTEPVVASVAEAEAEAENLTPEVVTGQVKQSNTLDIKPRSPPQKSKSAAPIFSPYQSMARFNGDLDKKMMDEHFKQRQHTQGISPMQALMPAVPKREYVKTLDEKIQEATTQIGNETFVKQDGVCAQTTDLSFIEEGLTSVTSYSDCGETDDERYFREFMKKALKK